ncbi:hypothetical protein B0H21DRAFT_47952 [Amylocystis lapponica]|nr:hypothetical protein B0H21DRAFT_47952 [Amylocystis lapponica]
MAPRCGPYTCFTHRRCPSRRRMQCHPEPNDAYEYVCGESGLPGQMLVPVMLLICLMVWLRGASHNLGNSNGAIACQFFIYKNFKASMPAKASLTQSKCTSSGSIMIAIAVFTFMGTYPCKIGFRVCWQSTIVTNPSQSGDGGDLCRAMPQTCTC